MSRRHILPPQTTALERAIDTTMPNWDDLAEMAGPDATKQSGVYQNWLAAHWQITQFAPYFSSTEELLRNAMPWLRIRGNAQSVKTALKWLGYTSVLVEEDGYYLHINPGREISNADIPAIAHVVRASIPLHVNFYRIFYRWDMRAMRLDASRLDDALLDNDSGTWVELGNGQEPIKTSQNRTTSAFAQKSQWGERLLSARCHLNADKVQKSVGMRLDFWVLDSTDYANLQEVHCAGISTRLHLAAIRPAKQPHTTPGVMHSSGQATRPRNVQASAAHQQGHLIDNPAANNRQWQGRWDDQPWRKTAPSKTTFLPV